MDSTTFLEIYRQNDSARHLQAVTTINNASMQEAFDKVTGNIGLGTFIALLELYQGRSTEDLARDLDISHEIAEALKRLMGMGD